ncbi:MAG: hypothetical protein E7566_00535 [Ruminococcaceae bacterium]|nr:hypothetical protein [Oscillospiraceae bacterium]
MKNTLKLIALILCLLFVASLMVACNKDNDKKAETQDTTAIVETTTETPKEAGLVGSWVSEDMPDYVYVFNADGTGTYSVLKFTYEDLGEKISILFDGNTVASEFEYTIEGNKLTLIDSFGEPVVYIKK